MREQLNNNPMAQLALVAVLLVAGAFLFISMTGGGESESAESEAGVTTPATELSLGASVEGVESGAVSGSPAEAIPPPTVKPPVEVTAAWESGATVVLLFVHDGGIDDDLVQDTTETLSSMPGVTVFVATASQIARYSAISGGVGVERVPALVVLTPKEVGKGAPTASVRYGFQSHQAVVQAVVDAGYQGPTLAYHP
ncbi:MAG TPA: hypothetical protein VKB23_11345 [Solirubrobacterales bacterium]|nr:hypothetical protein [Solirubrobacterales bacterium]